MMRLRKYYQIITITESIIANCKIIIEQKNRAAKGN